MTPSDQQALIDDINKIKKAQRHQKKKEVDSSNPSNKKNIHRSTTYADYNDNNFNTNNIHTKMRSSGNTRAQRSMSAIDHHNRHSLSHQQRGRASLVGDRKSIIASMISNNRKKMKDKDRNQRKVRSMVTGRGIEAGGGGEGPLDPPEPASNSSSGSDSDSDSERDSKSYSGSSVHYSDDSDYDNNAAYNLAQRKNDEGREKGKTVPRIVGARKPDKHRERLNRRRQYEEDEKIRIQIEEKEKKEGRKQRALLRRATERKNRGAPRTEVKDNLRRKDIDLDVNFWIDMEAEDKEQEEEGGEKEREKEEGIGGGTRTNDAGHVDEEHKYRTRESEEGSAGAQQKAQGKQKRKGGRKSRKRNSDLSHHQRHSSNNSRLSEEKEGSDGDRTFGLPMGVLQRQFARHTAGDVVEHKQRKTDARREERERMTSPNQGNTATDTGKTNEGSAAAKKHETGPRQIDAVIYEHDSIATACVALAYNESSCLPVYDIASGLCTRVFDHLDLCDIMMLKQMFRERAATQKAEEEKDKATQRKRDATTKELRLRHMQMLEEKRKNRVIKNSNNYNPFTSVDSDTDDEEGDDGISWLAGKNVKNNADKDRNDITDRYRALTDGNSIGNTSTNSTVMDSKHNVDDSIVVETSHETNGTGGHGHRQGQGQEHVQPSKGNDPLPVTLEELSLLKVSDLFAHTQKDARESVFAVSADRKLFKTVSLMLKLRLRYVLVLDDQALGKNDVVNVTEKRGVARVKGVITVENVLDMMYRVCVYAQNAILARYMNQSLRKLKMHRQHSSKLSKKDRREKEKNKEREREETREGRSSSSSSSSSLSMPRTLAMGQGRGKGALRDCYIHCVGGRTTVADTLAVLHRYVYVYTSVIIPVSIYMPVREWICFRARVFPPCNGLLLYLLSPMQNLIRSICTPAYTRERPLLTRKPSPNRIDAHTHLYYTVSYIDAVTVFLALLCCTKRAVPWWAPSPPMTSVCSSPTHSITST